MAVEIHESAVVDPSAELGVDVTIGPFVVVGAGSKIGDGTLLESHCVIKADTQLGKNNHIHPNAVIGGEPQHTAYKGEKTFTRLGDNNIIRECVTIHRGTVQGEGETVLGSNCMLMAYAHVAHDCIVGDNVIMANAVQLAGHVQVGRNVIISGLAAVQQFIRIGEYAFLGGASGYKLDVPPFMLAHGVRGKLFGPNLIGLRRNGFDSEACKGLKKAYKVIFRSGLTKEAGLAQVEQEIQGIAAVDRLIAFIRESKKGRHARSQALGPDMPDQPSTIGLIAGGRQFPIMVAKGIKQRNMKLVVAGFTGHTNMEVRQYADVWQELKLGKLNKLITYLKSNGVEKVIMAGTINKPKAMDLRHLDMRAIKLLFQQKNKGDSAILGILSAEFDKEGMAVVPAHTYLPELLTPEGLMTRRSPDEREREDIAFGWKIAKELGRMDIGQCVVVREGIVAAVEALEGTDTTISRGCQLGGEGCVVVKVFKPGQQEQIDLPSFGIDTLKTMAAGGATCIGVEAGKSLFFDRDAAIKYADKQGIAIVGLNDSGILD